MMRTASVAIITRTVPGREVFLERAIRSVLAQSFDDIVHAIVVDGEISSNIKALVKRHAHEYRNEPVLLPTEKPYKRMEAASNLGIRATKSDYIVIHDDDDSWEKEFLAKGVDYLGHARKGVKGVVTRANRIDEHMADDKIIIDACTIYNPSLTQITLYDILGCNQFPPISFLFERAVFGKIGYFNEDMRFRGDWEFNIRFLQHFDIDVLPEALANYHIRPSTKDTTVGNSVIYGENEHYAIDASIRNAQLRQEINEGKVSLGSIAGQSKNELYVKAKVELLEQKLLEVENIIREKGILARLRKSIPYRMIRQARNSLRSKV